MKRLIETIYIHRFSNSTMPLINLFKNCFYYWGFSYWISSTINNVNYMNFNSDLYTYIIIICFILAEYGNLSCHLLLRDLRKKNTTTKQIPFPSKKYILTNMFSFVSCANYTYEFLAWISFSIMTNSLPCLIFTLCGFIQMTMWALKKQKNYEKEFKKYPKNRKSIIPFFI